MNWLGSWMGPTKGDGDRGVERGETRNEGLFTGAVAGRIAPNCFMNRLRLTANGWLVVKVCVWGLGTNLVGSMTLPPPPPEEEGVGELKGLAPEGGFFPAPAAAAETAWNSSPSSLGLLAGWIVVGIVPLAGPCAEITGGVANPVELAG